MNDNITIDIDPNNNIITTSPSNVRVNKIKLTHNGFYYIDPTRISGLEDKLFSSQFKAQNPDYLDKALQWLTDGVAEISYVMYKIEQMGPNNPMFKNPTSKLTKSLALAFAYKNNINIYKGEFGIK